MASITFVGAAGTVTGSKHLVTIGDKHIFVDCGMFQGLEPIRVLNDAPLPIPAAQIDAVIITHGHLDHVGYLPKLVKDGFTGPIHCTPPTRGVAEIVLDDAAHLQEMMRRRGFSHNHDVPDPTYYDADDVARTLALVQTHALHQPFEVAGVTEVTYFNAGHILGSAFAALRFDNKRVIFSGDVGRFDRPLLYDPEGLGAADAIVCESTYGDRVHPAQPLDALRDVLLAGIARGGAIVIPSFAVERTQDMLLAIATIQQREPRIAELAIHLDSPMGEKVDALFEAFPDAHKPIPNDGATTPFGVAHFTEHRTTDESKALNDLHGPLVIISSSGMASGGRILHHLHNHLADPKATIVFPGYQSAGTLGYVLTHGAKTVHIIGDELPVRAAIAHLDGFSAHADRNELQRWLGSATGKPHLYAVHGEPASAAALAELAHDHFGWNADVAARGTTVTL